MNNLDVEGFLNSCKTELDHVKTLVDTLGMTSSVVPYVTKYALIKACGTIEISFKSIIADYCSRRSKKQVKRFVDRKIRDGSANPSYGNICRILADFDEDWNDTFRKQINSHPTKSAVMTSLQSLVDARNELAHGGNPTITISDVLKYFQDSRIVVETLDAVVK